jgi:hypothetical protein
MPYTIWNRGELVGETNLDYARVVPRQRSGEFLPTAYGENLMPTPAADLEPLPPGMQFTEGLCAELELRAPDGSVIPTEWIEIRDTGYTRALIYAARVTRDAPRESTNGHHALTNGLAIDDELDDADEFEIEIDDFEIDGDDDWDRTFPRYEVDIRLVDETQVP